MTQLTKRQKETVKHINPDATYAIDEALKLIQSLPKAKFNEAIDVCINLGIDARKTDQNVRGVTSLPHGTGKEIRVAVFAEGDKAEEAKKAGADAVGMAELAASMKKGDLNYNVVIASPATMKVVGPLGQLLGPRGLMPNPKVGTVTNDVAEAVRKAKAGQARYRNDKGGTIHASIGKIDFTVAALKENLEAIMQDLKKAKPASAKGTYFKKLSLSSTMGPGLRVDISSINV